MSENLLKVQPIRNGTVIDHIEAGRGRKILDILELGNSGTTISLLINVQSKKQKRKDIIKVEDRELDENEISSLYRIVAGILHFGNIAFTPKANSSDDACEIGI